MANKMQQFIKIYYSIFMWSSTCFGRHTAHYQELKTALAASGFCIRGRLLDVEVAERCQFPATSASNSVSPMQNQRLLVHFWAP